MLSVENLRKAFPARGRTTDETVAVDDISLEVKPGQLFTLLGPSGCGKTTTLRCVAGLERPDRGEITVAGRVLYSSEKAVDVPAHDRGLGVVFQSYALWPHMNVAETVAFPLRVMPRRRRRLSSARVRERVEQTLAIVRLERLATRSAGELSGGQQQRVALARALVTEPPLLLMDEPLSNLDATLREEMRFELRRLQHELGVTALHVTHDQAEALALSDVVAVMRDGRIEQVGAPQEVYRRPRSRFVAKFLGDANLIEGVVHARNPDGSLTIQASHGMIKTPAADDRANGALAPGAPLAVAIRSEDIHLHAGHSQDGNPNHWVGTVRESIFRGDSVDHIVRVGSAELRVRAPATISVGPGTEVTLSFLESACVAVR